MLILLAVLGCGTPEATTLVEGEDGVAHTTVAAVEGAAIVTSLEGVAPPIRRERPPVALPVGEARVDDGCFGGALAETAAVPPPSKPNTRARPKPRPSPRPSPSPSTGSRDMKIAGAARNEEPGTAAPSGLVGRGGGGASAGDAGGALAAAPAEPAPMPDAAPMPEAEPTPEATVRGGEFAAVDSLDDDRSRAAKRAPRQDEDADDELAEAEEEAKPEPGPVLDWGATVYLSNDDSMSLASAQRLLWTVDNGRTPRTSEIRPHELLNYFSFDTAPVPEGRLFSVLGSAAQEGETLSVAFAVRGALPERQPLDLTLVVDRSGSMNAEGRMEYTRRGLRLLADQLERGDRVDLVLFDSRVCTPLQDFVVGRDDPELLRSAIERITPRGSTDLDGGLREAYRIQTSREQAETHGRNQRVLLLTDAQLNTGNVDQALVSEVGRHFEEHDIRLTGVGVGRDFNDKMLDMLTEKGKGAYVYLGSEAVVDRVFGAGFRSLTETLAHDVRFALDLPDSLAMERFYGEESSTVAADVQPIHYYAGTSQVFLQDLRLRDGRIVRDDPVVLTISWRDARTGEPDELKLRTTVGALVDGDRRNLDKARALIAWSDVALARAMGGDACGEPLGRYGEVAGRLGDDAEIAYVTGLTGKLCRGVDVARLTAPGVAFKVKVDADVPIAEVGLRCAGTEMKNRLSGSDTVARFDRAQPGACTVTLQGAVPLQARVEVPSTGGDVRCLLRGGRLTCG